MNNASITLSTGVLPKSDIYPIWYNELKQFFSSIGFAESSNAINYSTSEERLFFNIKLNNSDTTGLSIFTTSWNGTLDKFSINAWNDINGSLSWCTECITSNTFVVLNCKITLNVSYSDSILLITCIINDSLTIFKGACWSTAKLLSENTLKPIVFYMNYDRPDDFIFNNTKYFFQSNNGYIYAPSINYNLPTDFTKGLMSTPMIVDNSRIVGIINDIVAFNNNQTYQTGTMLKIDNINYMSIGQKIIIPV